jgi:hypothetical protein
MEQKHVAAALVKAQTGFAPALKTSVNPHFKSRYADLAACIEAVIDSLNSNGIALVQRQHPHEGGVAIETLFVHESGETLSAGTLTVPAAKQDPQGYGSALTYCRRYSLMAACGIAPEDDDGNAAVKAKPTERHRAIEPVVEMIPKDELASLKDLAAEVQEHWGVNGPSHTLDKIKGQNLTQEQYVGLWSFLPSDIRAALKKESLRRDQPKAA